MTTPAILTDQIEMVEASKLFTHPDNPRRGDLGVIKESIQHHGFYGALLVQRSTGYIIAGNHRFQAAVDLGMVEFPVLYIDCDEDEAERIMLVDNRSNDKATNDPAQLLIMVQGILDRSGDLLGTGYTEEDLEAMMREAGVAEEPGAVPEAQIDKAEELQEKWQVQRGQIWQIGTHRLMCGDATSTEDVAALMDGAEVQLIITDPPYGVSYADKNEFLNAIDKGNHVQTPISGDHETPENMSTLWKAAFSTVRQFAAGGASYYVTGPQGGDLLLLLLALKDSDFPLRHMLIWAKNNHVLGRCDYNYKHEPIIFGWVEGAHTFVGPDAEVSLWEIDRPQKSDLHPTMKPVELYARAMRNSSKTGWAVLDPFAGSGPVFVAAEQAGRLAYGMELEPMYCSVVLERMSEMGLTPELLGKTESEEPKPAPGPPKKREKASKA